MRVVTGTVPGAVWTSVCPREAELVGLTGCLDAPASFSIQEKSSVARREESRSTGL